VADVVLVGLPGTGKTSVGRALADVLGLAFRDTDDVFAEREGESVQEYLRAHDEAQFRQHEYEALLAALEGPGVVATGGGSVSLAPAREALRHEVTIWLDCPDDVIVTRLADGDRPLLGEHPAARLAELRARRGEWYRDVSRSRVDAQRSLDEVVQDVVRLVHAARTSS